MDSILSEILFEASHSFIIIGTFIALILGLCLIFAPAVTLKFNEKINTHISLREKTKKIETVIKSEPFFYKHSKVSGAILVISSIFLLYTLATFDPYPLIPLLAKSITPLIWGWLIQSAQIFFFISCTFILVFGLIIFIRPSLAKGFERTANHWISTRRAFSKMSTNIDFTNKLVTTYPRAFGGSITIVSLIVLFLHLPKS